MTAPTADPPRHPRFFPVLLVGLALLAHGYGIYGVWHFDDYVYILPNDALRSLWPPAYLTGNTRPVLFVTLALNYAVGGTHPLTYHLFNLTLHAATALLLYGIVRRVLDELHAGGRITVNDTTRLAFAAAALWAVHPLTTMGVTYIWQRGESLMAFFYLLTIYAFLRGRSATTGKGWFVLSVLACLLGMGSKEPMMSAPLFVLLLDRALTAEGLRNVFSRRWPVHLALFATWACLGLLLMSAQEFHENPGVGFASKQATPLLYLATMPGVYLEYLRLTLWPSPLALDYGWPVATSIRDAFPAMIPVLVLLGTTAWLTVKRSVAGLPLALFFLVLAPSSSLMPMPDPLFEYRMHLPLMGLTTALVWALHVLSMQYEIRETVRRRIVTLCLTVAVGLLTVQSIHRTIDYTGPVSIWLKNTDVRPNAVRGWSNLGVALDRQGRVVEALGAFKHAVEIAPSHNPDPLALYGGQLCMLGRYAEGIAALEAALAHENLDRELRADAHYNLGKALVLTGRPDQAERHFEAVLRIRPNDRDAQRELDLPEQ